MRIATWNLNNRVGWVTFRPDAASAAIAIGADIIVLTEYFPQQHHVQFCSTLKSAGWEHQLMSKEGEEKANRILIAARCPLEPMAITLPDFDRQFSSNLLGVYAPSIGVSIIGVRVPWYDVHRQQDLIVSAWNWILANGSAFLNQPTIILGDLNVGLMSEKERGGDHFRRLLGTGWHRAAPDEGASFYGENGRTEIDHILGTSHCEFSKTEYIVRSGNHQLSGDQDAISDHAVLVTQVDVLPP